LYIILFKKGVMSIVILSWYLCNKVNLYRVYAIYRAKVNHF